MATRSEKPSLRERPIGREWRDTGNGGGYHREAHVQFREQQCHAKDRYKLGDEDETSLSVS